MIDTTLIQKIVEQKLEGTDMFLVEIKQTPSNEIEVLIDSDSSVNIDSCVELNRLVNDAFDRDQEDFELTVASWGIGQPLKLLRQYKKMIGREVEIVLKNGAKLIAELKDADGNSVTVEFQERVAVEGKKRKQLVTTVRQISLDEIKSTKEYINFR